MKRRTGFTLQKQAEATLNAINNTIIEDETLEECIKMDKNQEDMMNYLELILATETVDVDAIAKECDKYFIIKRVPKDPLVYKSQIKDLGYIVSEFPAEMKVVKELNSIASDRIYAVLEMDIENRPISNSVAAMIRSRIVLTGYDLLNKIRLGMDLINIINGADLDDDEPIALESLHPDKAADMIKEIEEETLNYINAAIDHINEMIRVQLGVDDYTVGRITATSCDTHYLTVHLERHSTETYNRLNLLSTHDTDTAAFWKEYLITLVQYIFDSIKEDLKDEQAI